MPYRRGGGGSGGGGGPPVGPPDAVAYYDGGGNATGDPAFIGGALDPFLRPGVHDYRLGPTVRGAVYRLGSWGIDGCPENVTSEGFVCYGANALGNGPDGSQGGMGFYEPNGFGSLQIIPGVNGGNTFYSCGFEDGGPMAPFGLDGFIVNDNLASPIFQVRRSDATTLLRVAEPFIDGTGFIGTGKAKFLRVYAYNVNPNGGNFSVATLPPFGLEGDISYATDGRKIGEGPGAGTGVPVYFSNGQWLTFSGDTVVLA